MTPSPLVSVLIALTLVVALGWLLGRILHVVGQPPVIGEVLAGIALGPSVLGQLWPDSSEILSSGASALGVLAQVGILIYMFLVGLELNLDALAGQSRSIIVITSTGIVVPFGLGVVVSLMLYPHFAGDDAPQGSFALFLGVALAITAFPVLARILSDHGLTQTPLGRTALACAALGDAAAWCLLAFVVGIAQAKVGGAIVALGMTALFIAVMFLAVRPLAAKLLVGRELTRSLTALVFIALLVSALTTEFIGVHAIFGAFLLGAVIPHDSAVAHGFSQRLGDLVTVLLLPAFFAFTGLRTQIGLVAGVDEWLICLLITAVATIGKIGGTVLAARWVGMTWRSSSALGALMNTRGLMELIVLNIGLDLKIISPTLFAMMVLMALATTMLTAPLLKCIGMEEALATSAPANA